MLSPLQDFFHYSRGERRGVFVLVLIIGLLFGWYFVRDYFATASQTDFSKFEADIAAFEASRIDSKTKKDNIEYFVFNPNTISIEEWMKLGFSEKQAQAIEKYKDAGAVFKVKKDVLKLFMIDEFKYAQLEAFIDLPDQAKSNTKNYKNFEQNKFKQQEGSKQYIILFRKSLTPVYKGLKHTHKLHYHKNYGEYWYCIAPFESETAAKQYAQDSGVNIIKILEVNSLKGYYPIVPQAKKEYTKEVLMIDINTATAEDFAKVSGIGPSYAKRIVKYRTDLGGFTSVAQMKEVYMLPPEVIDDNLNDFVLINTTTHKININTADVATLRAHPYITWNIANSIVQIRNTHGNYKSVADIKLSKLIDEELYLKLVGYLEVE